MIHYRHMLLYISDWYIAFCLVFITLPCVHSNDFFKLCTIYNMLLWLMQNKDMHFLIMFLFMWVLFLFFSKGSGTTSCARMRFSCSHKATRVIVTSNSNTFKSSIQHHIIYWFKISFVFLPPFLFHWQKKMCKDTETKQLQKDKADTQR